MGLQFKDRHVRSKRLSGICQLRMPVVVVARPCNFGIFHPTCLFRWMILTCLSPFLISMVGPPTSPAFSVRFGAAKTDSFSIQYDHHTHSEPLKAHGILPQGDPLGPIICSLWVQSGVMSVSTSFMLEAGPSSMQIYLDDRTLHVLFCPRSVYLERGVVSLESLCRFAGKSSKGWGVWGRIFPSRCSP